MHKEIENKFNRNWFDILYLFIMAAVAWFICALSFINPEKKLPFVDLESTFSIHVVVICITVFITYCAVLRSFGNQRRDDLYFCSGMLFVIGLFILYWHIKLGGLVMVASNAMRPKLNNA